MTYSIYQASIEPMIHMLQNLSRILDKAVTEAGTKHIPLQTLLDTRLAPDMFAFPRQIQLASDSAKSLAARLAGEEPPKYADTEKTFPELKVRVEKTITYLQSLDSARFVGAEDRPIAFQGHRGPVETIGETYARFDRVPNFYFHVVVAYSCLRAAGIDVGKRDYLGN